MKRVRHVYLLNVLDISSTHEMPAEDDATCALNVKSTDGHPARYPDSLHRQANLNCLMTPSLHESCTKYQPRSDSTRGSAIGWGELAGSSLRMTLERDAPALYTVTNGAETGTPGVFSEAAAVRASVPTCCCEIRC